MKYIANCISIVRIFFSLGLILVKPLSTAFLIIYIICGITDALDGYIARKTSTTSRIGEKLDSIADFIMVMMLIISLYPVINITVKIIIWIAIIAVIRCASIIIAFVKYKTLGMIHTYANKFTGFLIFIFPILFTFVKIYIFIYIICVVATVSAVEELLIQILSNEFQANRKSIYKKSV